MWVFVAYIPGYMRSIISGSSVQMLSWSQVFSGVCCVSVVPPQWVCVLSSMSPMYVSI